MSLIERIEERDIVAVPPCTLPRLHRPSRPAPNPASAA